MFFSLLLYRTRHFKRRAAFWAVNKLADSGFVNRDALPAIVAVEGNIHAVASECGERSTLDGTGKPNQCGCRRLVAGAVWRLTGHSLGGWFVQDGGNHQLRQCTANKPVKLSYQQGLPSAARFTPRQ